MTTDEFHAKFNALNSTFNNGGQPVTQKVVGTTSQGFIVKDLDGNKTFVYFDSIPTSGFDATNEPDPAIGGVKNQLKQGESYSHWHPMVGGGARDEPILNLYGQDYTGGEGKYMSGYLNATFPSTRIPLPIPQDIRNATSSDSQLTNRFQQTPGRGIYKQSQATSTPYDLKNKAIQYYDTNANSLDEVPNFAPIPKPGESYKYGGWSTINKAPNTKALAKNKVPNPKPVQGMQGTVNGQLA